MIIGNMEAEIVTLRKDVQKKNMQNSSKVLDDIINSQKSHLDKSEHGYNQIEKGSSSKTKAQETNPQIYAEEEGFMRAPHFRRYSITRYQTIFFGLCYACNNFGHKVVNCRANNKNNN
jgi:hypothetical protein